MRLHIFRGEHTPVPVAAGRPHEAHHPPLHDGVRRRRGEVASRVPPPRSDVRGSAEGDRVPPLPGDGAGHALPFPGRCRAAPRPDPRASTLLPRVCGRTVAEDRVRGNGSPGKAPSAVERSVPGGWTSLRLSSPTKRRPTGDTPPT